MPSELQVNTITEATSGSGITFAKDIIPATPLSNRNMVINGAMLVAQRGTSSTSSGYHSVDRFTINSSGGTTTQSQGTETSGTVYELGLTKYARITNTANATGAGDYRFIQQSIEGQNIVNSGWNFKSASSYVTLSFWVRASVAQNYYGLVKSDDGTAQYYSFDTGSLSANTWTKVTKTIPGNSSIQIDNDNGSGFQIMISPFTGTTYTDASRSLNAWSAWNTNQRFPDFTTTWGSTNGATFDVTGVMLERGSVATPFEHRSYADELLKCQRYYYKIVEGNTKWIGSGGYYSSSVFVCYKQWPVEMRTTPTIDYVTGTSYYEILGDGTDACDTLMITRAHPLGGGFDVGGNVSGTSGDGGVLSTNNASSYVAVKAEL